MHLGNSYPRQKTTIPPDHILRSGKPYVKYEKKYDHVLDAKGEIRRKVQTSLEPGSTTVIKARDLPPEAPADPWVHETAEAIKRRVRARLTLNAKRSSR